MNILPWNVKPIRSDLLVLLERTDRLFSGILPDVHLRSKDPGKLTSFAILMEYTLKLSFNSSQNLESMNIDQTRLWYYCSTYKQNTTFL